LSDGLGGIRINFSFHHNHIVSLLVPIPKPNVQPIGPVEHIELAFVLEDYNRATQLARFCTIVPRVAMLHLLRR
jgi:hypothetical protein